MACRVVGAALQHREYGAPLHLWLSATVEMDGTVSLDLQAFNKTSTRLGEASFFRFAPVQRDGCRWLMDKLGSWIDPLETVTNGSLHSHGVRDGVAYFDDATGAAVFSIDSLDAFVADPATAKEPATNFLTPLLPLTGPVLGFDMQLHQNAFSTNMPLFSLDESFRWRFRLRAHSLADSTFAAVRNRTFRENTTAATRRNSSSVTAATRISPLQPIDDWHYPEEEAAEMQALLGSRLQVTQLRATGNATGTLTLQVANGSSVTLHQPGESAFGWVLRGFLSSPGPHTETDRQTKTQTKTESVLAVLEFEADRWGLVAFMGGHGRLSASAINTSGVEGGWGFRKGVGRVSRLRQPRLDPQVNTSAYYAQALADPTDALAGAMENASAFGEATFAAAAGTIFHTHGRRVSLTLAY